MIEDGDSTLKTALFLIQTQSSTHQTRGFFLTSEYFEANIGFHGIPSGDESIIRTWKRDLNGIWEGGSMEPLVIIHF